MVSARSSPTPGRRCVGLIVNPVAGMGGSVGLKGTDGDMYERALALGATPVAPERSAEFLSHLPRPDALLLLVAPGPMGEHHARGAGLDCEVVGTLSGAPGPGDTCRIAREMIARSAELIAFVGGDGTARDLCDAIDLETPVVAVPAGVKVYSAVFALNPRAAAGMLDAWMHGTEVGEREVLDIDEDAFRAGRLESHLYGALLVPEVPQLVQAGKEASSGLGEREVKQEVAAYVSERMQPDRLYLLGPGTTVKAVADALGVEKTLLGVDAVLAGRLLGRDLNERAILELLEQHGCAEIVVTPLGGSGFIFGRGNKQFTPEVLRRVGIDNVTVIATADKLRKLSCLRVDTGDAELDRALAGYRPVIVGYRYSRMADVRA